MTFGGLFGCLLGNLLTQPTLLQHVRYFHDLFLRFLEKRLLLLLFLLFVLLQAIPVFGKTPFANANPANLANPVSCIVQN